MVSISLSISISEMPWGSFSGGNLRLAGISAKRASTLFLPIASSIAPRSASVVGMNGTGSCLPYGFRVIGRAHQGIHSREIRGLHLDHPAAAVGLLVDEGGIGLERFVHRGDRS